MASPPLVKPLYFSVSFVAHDAPSPSSRYTFLDEILSYLPSDDKQSFRNGPLVAKSGWPPPSTRLTSTTCPLWLDKISPESTGLLYHVRSLFCCDWELPSTSPPYLAGCLQDNLPASEPHPGQHPHQVNQAIFPSSQLSNTPSPQYPSEPSQLRCKVRPDGGPGPT